MEILEKLNGQDKENNSKYTPNSSVSGHSCCDCNISIFVKCKIVPVLN
jgi:hypothetical protein